MSRHVPSLLTLSNLAMGCISIVCAFSGKMEWIPLLVFIAIFADSLDGLVARYLGVSSEMGKELDSMADMVTFGVLPGVVMYHLLLWSWGHSGDAFPPTELFLKALPAFALTLFSAVRLAKFNIDQRDEPGFIGLPTPASTVFFIALITVVGENNIWGELVSNKWVLYGLTFMFSYLMVSPLRMFSNKFKGRAWSDNKLRYIFLILIFSLFGVFGYMGLALSTILYLGFSLLTHSGMARS